MPGPLIPIALMLAGMAANKMADDKVQKARNDRINAEHLRQRQLGEQADAVARQELEQQTRPAIEQDQDQSAANREAKYEAASPTTGDVATSSYQASPNAPTEVKSQLAGAVVDALRRGRKIAGAQAKLGAVGDAGQKAGFGLQRGAIDMNTIGGKSRSSSAILPFELQDANGAGEGWRTVGDVANVAGMGYSLYGMTTPPGNAAYSTSLKNPLFSH